MASHPVTRCAVRHCAAPLALDFDAEQCRHGTVTCEGCDPRDACVECAVAGEAS